MSNEQICINQGYIQEATTSYLTENFLEGLKWDSSDLPTRVAHLHEHVVIGIHLSYLNWVFQLDRGFLWRSEAHLLQRSRNLRKRIWWIILCRVRARLGRGGLRGGHESRGEEEKAEDEEESKIQKKVGREGRRNWRNLVTDWKVQWMQRGNMLQGMEGGATVKGRRATGDG